MGDAADPPADHRSDPSRIAGGTIQDTTTPTEDVGDKRIMARSKRGARNRYHLRKHMVWAIGLVVLGIVIAVAVAVGVNWSKDYPLEASSASSDNIRGFNSSSSSPSTTAPFAAPPAASSPIPTQQPDPSAPRTTNVPTENPTIQTLSPTGTLLSITSDPATAAPSSLASGSTTTSFTETKLLDPNGSPNDNFAYDVAVHGDTVVVGARFRDYSSGSSNRGAAFVFVRSSSSAWTLQAQLVASDGAADDSFGDSVQVSGDTVVVGARYGDTVGAAYVFVRGSNGTSSGGGSWTQQQKLTAGDGELEDEFGRSVAIDGDTVLVGARRDDNANGVDAGTLFVFARTEGNTWILEARLTASDGGTEDRFGFAIGISGDTIVSGAYKDDDFGEDSGAAFIFTRTDGVWTEQAKLAAPNRSAGDEFGISVSIDGGTVIVAAWRDENDGGPRLFVYEQVGTSWIEQAQLMPSAGGSAFGRDSSISGDTIVVGAYEDADNGFESGSAFVFRRTGDTWTEEQKLSASDGAADHRFGFSVAASKTLVVVGAYKDNENGSNSGSVYVYEQTQL